MYIIHTNMIVHQNLPHQRSYWAIPNQLLGGCYPGATEPTVMKERLQGIIRSGVTLMLNLMEPDETNYAGLPFASYMDELQKYASERNRSIRMVRIPIKDMNIPTKECMRSILDIIHQEIQTGGVVYVHCWGGKGRTATVIGCYLLEYGHVTPEQVLQRIKDLTEHAHSNLWPTPQSFWPTPQTAEQCTFVTDWLKN